MEKIMTPQETVKSITQIVNNEPSPVEHKFREIHKAVDRYRELRKERFQEIFIGIGLVTGAFVLAQVFSASQSAGVLTGATILIVCSGVTYLLAHFTGTIEIQSNSIRATGYIAVFVFCCALMAVINRDELHRQTLNEETNNTRNKTLGIPNPLELIVPKVYAEERTSELPAAVPSNQVLPPMQSSLDQTTTTPLEFKIIYPYGALKKKRTSLQLAKTLSSTGGQVEVYSQGSPLYAVGNYFRDADSHSLNIIYNPYATDLNQVKEIIRSSNDIATQNIVIKAGKPGGADILIKVESK